MNLTPFTMKQLPVVSLNDYSRPITWGSETLLDWVIPRVLELTFTAWDIQSLAEDCGYNGPPFVWNEERRFLLRCELDAAFFHIYLGQASEWDRLPQELLECFPTPRDAVSYIMDSFPIVKRKDDAKHDGDYRTKRVILEIYDALAESTRSGKPYKTRLDPPPADDRCCHTPKKAEAFAN